MKISRFLTSVRQSLWLVPVICVAFGIFLSLVTIALDRHFDYKLIPESVVGGPDAAMEILAVVAASMISLAALVLTITMVVVQLAMGQFSPRIVQRILRDKPSQFAIGLFVATFVHSLLALREVDPGSEGQEGTVPGLAVLTAFVLVVVSIAVLVIYVQHLGQTLRVSALIELVGDDTRKLLDRVFPDKGDDAAPTDVANRSIVSPKSGVVTTIGYEHIIEEAKRAGCIVELVPRLGEFVPASAPLFIVRGDAPTLDDKRLTEGVVLKFEPTLDQDVSYGLRMLVDIAERSLSDSPFQDPSTAVQAIDRLHDILRQLARRPFPDGQHRDEDGELRLVVRVLDWDGFVHLAFDEIRMAGAGSPQVARQLRIALFDLRRIALTERIAVIDEQIDLLTTATMAVMDDERDARRTFIDDERAADRRDHS
ncbi:DUF2254 domain-containing protein [Arthrobacter glacialis]|uniref:DUF2254 domain-containing protein n=1 Tax=Arthrobacter glacialis TaxID=1664 RepID=UPI0013FD7ABD|nr:DUF2254 domain-containing protein [Arthrobacter glacialis]